MRSRLAWLICAALPVAASIVSAAVAATAPQTKTTKSYVFKLSLGKSEEMWTLAQVAAQHPKTGEIMLSGSMAHLMSMGGSPRHIEVQITSRASGKVVTGAHPTLSVHDTLAMDAMMDKVSVAEMKGVGMEASDVHYGNNIDLVTGHLYKVTVTLKGEVAVFLIKPPT